MSTVLLAVLVFAVAFTAVLLWSRHNMARFKEPSAKRPKLREMYSMDNYHEYMKEAKRDPIETLGAWGKQHGFKFERLVDPGTGTAFLRGPEKASDRKELGPGVTGEINGSNLALCHFTYMVRPERSYKSQANNWLIGKITGKEDIANVDFTVCRVECEGLATVDIPTFYLKRNDSGLYYQGAPISQKCKKVDLESSVLAHRGTLLVPEDEGGLMIRAIFSPPFIDWIVSQEPAFFMTEYENATLVIYGPTFAVQKEALEAYLTWADGFLKQLNKISSRVPEAA